MQGIGIANVVSNRERVVGWGESKKLKSVITYDDGASLLSESSSQKGSNWKPLVPPEKMLDGKDWSCDRSDLVRRQLMRQRCADTFTECVLASRALRHRAAQLR